MKHRENSYLGILYQYESIIIISMSNISNKYINEAQRKITVSESPIKIIDQYNQSCQMSQSENSGTLNVQSRDEYPLIDSPNATFASS